MSGAGVRIRISPRACLWTVVLIGGMFAALLAFATSAHADYTVNVCNNTYQNENVFTAIVPSDGSVVAGDCNGTLDGGLDLLPSSTVPGRISDRGALQANAPAGLEIVGVSVPGVNAQINNGYPWGGGAYWQGGSAQLNNTDVNGLSVSAIASPYFGLQIVCVTNPTCPVSNGDGGFDAYGVSLTVRETVGPSLSAASGLWQASGWVRGVWPLDVSGDSPSGICALSGTFDRAALIGTDSQHDAGRWHQCSAPPVTATINTAAYGQGAAPLVISGSDAAGKIFTDTKTIQIDNSTPTLSLSLSGPADASSTAGTQFVTATAGGSPSGIDAIVCAVDRGLARAYPGPSARVPVIGLGKHQVNCTAYNNAVDPNGVHGVSQTSARSIKIGAPTALAVTFARPAGLRCKLQGRPRRQRKRISVTKCHLERHKHAQHKSDTPPRLTANATKRVRYGQTTTVSGLLRRADGPPLGGKKVEVLTATDNETARFKPAAEAITAANGTWTVSLPAGPSRLIKAIYAGSATTERSTSRPVRLRVAAKVELKSVTPQQLAWGQTVTIKGRLLGGYLPAAGINVRLRIGIAKANITFGVKEHVSGNGNFTATFTFGVGDPSIHRIYWFQIASLPAGDYPYSPSASGRIYVQVGG